MKTMNDILYTRTESNDDSGTIMIAIGIGGEVVELLTTYVWFYDLIKNNLILENTNAPEGKFWLDIKNNDNIIETIECTEKLSAILRSNPDVIEIVRAPLPPIDSIGDLRWISAGWNYDSDYNFVPPVWWKKPVHKEQVLTEKQKEAIRKMGWKID